MPKCQQCGSTIPVLKQAWIPELDFPSSTEEKVLSFFADVLSVGPVSRCSEPLNEFGGEVARWSLLCGGRALSVYFRLLCHVITVSTLCRRLKILFFFTSRDWQYSNSHKLEEHSKSQYPVYNRGQTHSVFYSVTRSLSCERLHRQTGKPSPPPTCVVFSSTYLSGWTDHGAVTASNGRHHEDAVAARTKGLNCTSPFEAIWKAFLLCKRLPEGHAHAMM